MGRQENGWQSDENDNLVVVDDDSIFARFIRIFTE